MKSFLLDPTDRDVGKSSMAMEVSCGNCTGRLLVEMPGVIVVCPHCGIHLSIPESSSSIPSEPSSFQPTNITEPLENESNQVPMEPVEGPPILTSLNPMPSEASRAETIVFTGIPSLIPKSPSVVESPSSIFHSPEEESPAPVSPENVGWLSAPNLSLTDARDPELERFEETPPKEDVPAIEPESLPPIEPSTSTPDPESGLANSKPETNASIDAPAAQADQETSNGLDQPWEAPASIEQLTPELSFGEFGLGQPSIDVVPAGLDSFADIKPAEESIAEVLPSENIASSAVGGSVDESISRLTFLLMIVGSYASLTTIILIYLYFFGRAHQLESLPDLKTIQQSGGRVAVPKPENNLPPGHQLRFGQSQQYGNIRVTPLRVTRGPISFEHQSGDKSEERTPSEPVLKLWLKFENVSASGAITPLDTTLMFFRRVLDHRIASYNVIFREADRTKKNPQLWYPFNRMAVDTEWLIVGQHTNQPLEARESFDTFIPSEEELDGLTGELVWRVHFRKGYGPRTGNGVTTLIDVRFNSDDIKPDAT